MKKIFSLTLAVVFATSLFAQKKSLWHDVPESSFAKKAVERRIVPDKYRTVSLDLEQLANILANAPMRFSEAAKQSQPTLPIPMPAGELQDFQIVEAPVMHPKLAKKYPYIRSYAGWSESDPTAYLRFGVTQKGFHAVLFSARHSTVFIDAYATGDTEHYVCYFKKDYSTDQAFECGVTEFAKGKNLVIPEGDLSKMPGDCVHREYRLALACTGEYATFHGGNVPDVMAAFNEAMTRVNGIYEREAASTMVLVPNTDQLIFLNSNSDPYTNNNGGTMLGENQTTVDNVIGNSNYDIGHVFSTGGGGVAYLGSLCNNNLKAGGVTGQPTPTGDPFWVDYVAHEMGHQFGANHTQNNSCNRNNPTAMEPGSASTIMGYAGICPPNVQNNSDDYFHAISLDEIHAHITNNGNCSSNTASGNNAPTVDVPAGAFFNVPVSTPFALTADANDADGDPLTYCWEQMDNQVASMPPAPTNTGGPAFRTFDPVESPTRYFPSINAVLNNNTPTWEVLPSVSRNMNFRCTVRDNHPSAGCVSETDVTLNFTASAGPFVVTEPNTSAVTWTALDNAQVNWDVANTDASPVNANTVDIYLSEDGGQTYPYVLAEGVPNDGTHTVSVPNVTTTTARVMVKGGGNVFFDVSDENFTIEMSSVPGFVMAATQPLFTGCQSGNAEWDISVTSIAGFNGPVTFSTLDVPAGANASFSPNPLNPSGTTTLTVGDLANVNPGTYFISVLATSSVAQQSIEVSLIVLDSVTSTVTIPAPADGTSGISPSQVELSWAAVANAEQYLVEISNNPSFQNILTSTSTADTEFNFTSALPNQVYYWRVKASNICNEGDFSETFAFQTAGFECGTYEGQDVPVTIPSNQVTTVSSTLNIPDDYPVATFYVYMDIDHSWVGDLSATLNSPSSTSVQLFDQPGVPASNFGCENDNLEVGFYDGAPNTATDFETTCNPSPPAISGDFQPMQPVASFFGESSAGTWTLEVSDAFDEDGGTINSWYIEMCGAIALPAANLLTNNVLTLPQGQSANITQTHLEVDNAPGTFTLLSLPENGTLNLSGMALSLGDQFTQQQVNDGLLSYTHDGSMTQADEFLFDVVDSEQGWLHGQTFQIEILDNSISATAALTQEIDCHDANNGVITVTASGGTGSLEYSIDGVNFQASNIFDGLAEGTYTITVQDELGFSVTTNGVTVASPTAITVSTTVADDDLTVNASGGTGTLEYSIDGTTYQASNQFFDLPNGTYTVYVRDENDCVETTTAIIAVNTVGISLAITQNVSCFGENDGVVTATAVGGTQPYEYSLNGGAFQSSNVFDGLAPGSYTVTVMDADGFTQMSNTVAVTEPDELTATATVTDDDITVNADGGTQPLEYSLNGGAFQSSNVFQNLPNGTYDITVQDANGCVTSTTATVALNNISVSVSILEPTTCAFSNDGVIEVNATGGMAPYEYSLNGGNSQTSNVFENVPGGLNSVQVTDSDGFTQTVTFDVPTPPAISGSAGANGYAVTVSASGGTGSLQYSLDGGPLQSSNEFFPVENGMHTLSIIDENGCDLSLFVSVDVPPIIGELNYGAMLDCHDSNNGSITVEAEGGVGPYLYSLNGGQFQSSNTFDDLSPGTYTVEIMDSGGFTTTLPAANISAPAALVASASSSGNDVTVTADGGTSPYQYSLDGGPLQSSSFFENVPNGFHPITVLDANGCETTTSVLVNVTPLQVSASVSQLPSCPGESDAIIVIQATGGTPPLEYSLDGQNFQSSSTFTGLPAGSYQPTVKDATGAIVVAPVLNIVDPQPIVPTGSTFGPVISAEATGGTGDYQYSLEGGDFQDENEFEVTSNGMYTVTVMDENGCTAEVDVIVNSPEEIFLTVIHVSCADFMDASITIDGVSGGYPPYMFGLNGGPVGNQTTWDGLGVGEYIFTVVDSTGYAWEAPPTLVEAPDPIDLATDLDGNTLTVNASGGVGDFQYSIDGGVTFQDDNVFLNLPNGTYDVVVIDTNGCIAETTVTINYNGVNEVNGGLLFEVSPNPSTGIFTLRMDSPSANALTFTVHDVAGRIVLKNEISQTGYIEQVLDLQHLANGTYQLRLTDGEMWGVKRLVVVR